MQAGAGIWHNTYGLAIRSRKELSLQPLHIGRAGSDDSMVYKGPRH